MINIFKGCTAASDREFALHIKKKKDEYDEGSNITEDELMKLALNKHANMKRDGKWNSPSQEEKQIIALQASLDEMKKERLQISKALKSHGSKGSKKGKGGEGTNKSKKKQGRGKDNTKTLGLEEGPSIRRQATEDI